MESNSKKILRVGTIVATIYLGSFLIAISIVPICWRDNPYLVSQLIQTSQEKNTSTWKFTGYKINGKLDTVYRPILYLASIPGLHVFIEGYYTTMHKELIPTLHTDLNGHQYF